MRRGFKICLSVMIVISVILLSSCGNLLESIVSQLEQLETQESSNTELAESTDTQVKEDVIPFSTTPTLTPYVLPFETFTDPVEEEASRIIDKAICKAISCVSTMKDSRHSNVTYGYEQDSNGFLASLDTNTRNAYFSITTNARDFSGYTLNKESFQGDLKKAFFSISEPLEFCDPFVNSYMTVIPKTYGAYDPDTDEITSVYSSLSIGYYNPYKDENALVSGGSATMGKIKHDISLFDHIIKRIVRFMPENLSAYDKYYYLAVVVTELVNYDNRPDNCYTSFGALVCGKAVCEGYSTAYALLCKEANLYCAYRMSNTHMWNMVKLEDGIYNVDLTWADDYEPNTYNWFRYFIRTDEQSVYTGHEPARGVTGTGSGSVNPYE